MKQTIGAFIFLLAVCAAAPGAETARSGEDLAREYSRGNYALYFAGEAGSFALLGAVVASGLSVKFREWAQRAARGPNRIAFLTAAILTVFLSVASLPLHIYSSYFREKRFGFARQTVLQWLGDWAKGLGIEIVLGGILITILYAVTRKFPRRFWLIAAAVAILYMVATVAIAPVFLAPLFNKFSPLPDSALRSRLLEVAHSQGIDASDVFEVDASRQSAHTNAYVAGLLGTERIVLYDTLLKTHTPREVVAVLGHEMGHYVLHHLWKGLALASLGILAACWLVRSLFPRLTSLKISDPAGLPLALLIVSAFSFLSTPIGDGFSRKLEHEADAFGLQAVRDPDAMETALRKFNTVDLSEYDPPSFIELWYYTHPSLRHRIEFCEEWKRTHAARTNAARRTVRLAGPNCGEPRRLRASALSSCSPSGSRDSRTAGIRRAVPRTDSGSFKTLV
jgi:STE24 endopeptidase